MRQFHHPERREHQRRGQVEGEQSCRQVDLADIVEHPRHDAPAVEIGSVGRQGALAPGAAGDVGERFGGEPPFRSLLERIGIERHDGPLSGDAAEIDVTLKLQGGGRVWHGVSGFG